MIDNFWFLFLAYSTITGAVLAYLLSLGARVRSLRREALLLTRVVQEEIAAREKTRTPDSSTIGEEGVSGTVFEMQGAAAARG